MTQSITESGLRDQWILENLESGNIKMDFSIDEEGNLTAFASLSNTTNDTINL